MNKKYQCNTCKNFLPTLIDLNYHSINCENLNYGKMSQEDKNYDWLEKNNFHSSKNKLSIKIESQLKKLSKKSKDHILINCPNCKSIVREDRLQRHIDKVHVSINSKKTENENSPKEIKNKNLKKPFIIKNPIVHVYRTTGESDKIRPRPLHLQDGKITENDLSPKFGEENGAILKKEKTNGIEIRYEQSLCSCNGNNERCIRCDGTGYYVKKIIEESDKNLSKFYIRSKLKSNNYSSAQELSFSNDFRGNDYGMRESGRFNSNPLHDDYD